MSNHLPESVAAFYNPDSLAGNFPAVVRTPIGYQQGSLLVDGERERLRPDDRAIQSRLAELYGQLNAKGSLVEGRFGAQIVALNPGKGQSMVFFETSGVRVGKNPSNDVAHAALAATLEDTTIVRVMLPGNGAPRLEPAIRRQLSSTGELDLNSNSRSGEATRGFFELLHLAISGEFANLKHIVSDPGGEAMALAFAQGSKQLESLMLNGPGGIRRVGVARQMLAVMQGGGGSALEAGDQLAHSGKRVATGTRVMQQILGPDLKLQGFDSYGARIDYTKARGRGSEDGAVASSPLARQLGRVLLQNPAVNLTVVHGEKDIVLPPDRDPLAVMLDILNAADPQAFTPQPRTAKSPSGRRQAIIVPGAGQYWHSQADRIRRALVDAGVTGQPEIFEANP